MAPQSLGAQVLQPAVGAVALGFQPEFVEVIAILALCIEESGIAAMVTVRELQLIDQQHTEHGAIVHVHA